MVLRNRWKGLESINTDYPLWLLVTFIYIYVEYMYLYSAFWQTLCLLDYFEKKKDEKESNLKYFGKIYVYRVVRFWPAMIFSMIMFTSVVYYLNDGIAWHELGNMFYTCEEHWWTPLLFVSDIVPFYVRDWKGCMRWTAMYSIDMKLFLILPPLVYIYKKGMKQGAIYITSGLVFTGLMCNMIAVRYFELFVGVTNLYDYQSIDTFMYKPWTHIEPYFSGVLLAFFYNEFKFVRIKATEEEKKAKYQFMPYYNWIMKGDFAPY